MASIFISYSRKNIDFAKRLTGALQEHELNFWVDWEGIPPTMDWWKQIETGIEEADIFLFLISPDSAKSKVCGQELDCAVKNGKRLIPLVVHEVNGDETPPQLSHLNWIFFRESDDFNAAINKLLIAIKTDYDWAQTHRRLQVKALDWERGNKDGGFLLRGKDLEEAEKQISVNANKDPHPTAIQREYVLLSRQGTTRQRRITTGILVFIIVMLIGISAYFATPRILNAINKGRAQALEEMVPISAGQVNIGSKDPSAKDAYYPEIPPWVTDLKAFNIDKYEVTNRIYRLCVKYADCTPPVRSIDFNSEEKIDHPVVSVTIIQAATYCNWVGRRLPTELEWERAARGPVDADRIWPWGEEVVDANRANMATQSFTPTGTMPVYSQPNGATPEGIFNLVGNVWEWTSSKEQGSYVGYNKDLVWDGKSKAFDQLETFVQRGGGWSNSIERITSRYFTYDLDAQPDAGFRCARD